ncbi:hypothetical protein FOA52_016202 [Chlamydomonas sp. UWO 241]|nr:hypothetical protein FOA52_016202 [Chlamydomonas sp. UWO 241]
MSSAMRRLASQVPQLSKGFSTSGATKAEIEKWSHKEMVLGDGHHGLRKGYNYDYEHGPHYLNPRKLTDLPWPPMDARTQVDNFMLKWNVGMKVMFGVAVVIPCFAVWWQQSKLAT